MTFFEDIGKIFSSKEFMGYISHGFFHTLIITLIAVVIGLLIGFIVAIIKTLASATQNPILKVLNVLANLYTTIIRGTPVALQLFIFVFAIFAIPGFKVYAVILCFGINSGAYVSENIRAGIQSIDKGQTEAGRSLGLSEIQTMVLIIIPQAIKNVIPTIGNEIIALLKETAIISMVGSTVGTLTFDLNQSATTIAFAISDYFAPSIIVALFYLIIVYLITLVVKHFEKRMSVSDRN